MGVGQLNTHDGAARYRRNTRGQGGHVARNIFCQLDNAAGFDTRRRFQLIHRDHGSRTHRNNLSFDMKVIEHRFQQARICFQRRLVEFWHRNGGRRIQQIKRWQNKAAKEIALSRTG